MSGEPDVLGRNPYKPLTTLRSPDAIIAPWSPRFPRRQEAALVETCLSELRRLARPEALTVDVRERRFIEHTLQIAIQAALDVASHIVSNRRLGEPRTNRELFDLLLNKTLGRV